VNRIDQRFSELQAAGRRALIPYVVAGDPALEWTADILHALVAAGADLLELGVPFSDPMADGPVIQQAAERAIARGVGLRHALEVVRAFRVQDATTPIVLMGYLNPIEQFGFDAFVERAAELGVDGVLLVDAPIEESAPFAARLAERGMHQIHLIAPTSPATRVQQLATVASGFVYYVSLRGVTGAGYLATDEVSTRLIELKQTLPVPVGVGFGISDAVSARRAGEHADAVIIGSALVDRLKSASDSVHAQAIAREFLLPIRDALDR
jgi:tryptophan synthase alpha chain